MVVGVLAVMTGLLLSVFFRAREAAWGSSMNWKRGRRSEGRPRLLQDDGYGAYWPAAARR